MTAKEQGSTPWWRKRACSAPFLGVGASGDGFPEAEGLCRGGGVMGRRNMPSQLLRDESGQARSPPAELPAPLGAKEAGRGMVLAAAQRLGAQATCCELSLAARFVAISPSPLHALLLCPTHRCQSRPCPSTASGRDRQLSCST
jgi:hypothetical protein